MKEDKLYEDIKYDISDLKTALAAGGYNRAADLPLCKEHLDELASLATTYGFEVVAQEPCSIRTIDAALFFGKGKVDELRQKGEEVGADVIIFDDEISPNQQRNLERIFKKPVIDRTELILEIFSQRAQTKEAMLQVELAKSHYQMPRLKRLWTHLSRQSSGGGGFLKGEGERQIEIDRRLVRKQITRLKKELEEVHHQREVQRKSRVRSGIPTFSIIGYTNVGKSTLLNALTDADVLMEDKLFATLDTTTRKFTLPNHQEILLIDTVGFIRKIPHTLVAAFKSTLEEAVFTDILLHLIDANHTLAEEHAESTYAVLKELTAEDKPIITVLNKVDALEDKKVIARYKLKYPRVVPISALNHEGFETLLEMMMTILKDLRKVVHLRIPQKEYALVSELMEEGRIITQDYEENDILLEVEIPKALAHKVEKYHDNSTG
ncbi:GTPase HflX [Candidatus Neptunochlamydia vexilliferae]|uniref:GTPase HflX n=1 Tax=Candidatus Neptunichlamydia vexilliferae TaxID=1651774 RepID=A0ABS0B0Q6_9BACT|nr:GTPase HflX [Candidatus Neptunochlamydia vexilliferae]MBF5059422.1 GTPase HflX [Candidatus Neptunochlamydia vexilliferae]